MKYLNFIVDRQGLIPFKHINHKNYSPLDGTGYGELPLHDFVDHGNCQDGSVYKELLALGASIYRLKTYYQILEFIPSVRDCPFTKHKISKDFEQILSYETLKREYKMRNVRSVQWRNKIIRKIYFALAKGYDMAKRRNRLFISPTRLNEQIKIIVDKTLPLGTKVKIPLEKVSANWRTFWDDEGWQYWEDATLNDVVGGK